MFGIVGGILNALTPSVVPADKGRRGRSPASPPPARAGVSTRSAGSPEAAPQSEPDPEPEPAPAKKHTSSSRKAPSQTSAKSKSSKKVAGSPVATEEEVAQSVTYNGEDIDAMLYVDIKAALKDLGLSCQGKKAVLADRLREHLQLQAGAAPPAAAEAAPEPPSKHRTRGRSSVASASPATATPLSSISKSEVAAKSAAAEPESSPAVRGTPAGRASSSRKRPADSPEEKPKKSAKTSSSKAPKGSKSVRIAAVIDAEEAMEVEPPAELAGSGSESESFFEAAEGDKDEELPIAPAAPASAPAAPAAAPAAPTPGSVSGVSLSADLLKILTAKFESTLRGEGSLTDTEYNMFQLLLEQSRAKTGSSVRFAPEVTDRPHVQPHVRFHDAADTGSAGRAYDTAPTPMPGRSGDAGNAAHVNSSNAGVTPFGKPLSAHRFAGHTPFVPREEQDSADSAMRHVASSASTPLRAEGPPANDSSLASRTDSYEMQVDSAEKSNPVPEIPSPVPLSGRWSSGSRESTGAFSAGRDSFGLWQSNGWQHGGNADSESVSASKKRDNVSADLNQGNTFPDSDFRAPKRQQVSFDASAGERKYVSIAEPNVNVRFSMGSASQPAVYTPSFKVNAASLGRHTGGLDSFSERKMYPFNTAQSGSSPHWPVGRSNFSNSTPLSVKSRAQMLTASASRRKLIRSRLESGSSDISRTPGVLAVHGTPAASAVVAKRILETLGEMVTPLEDERNRHPVSKLYKDADDSTYKKTEKSVKFLNAAAEDSKPQQTFAFKDSFASKTVEQAKAATPPFEVKKAEVVPVFGLSGKKEKALMPEQTKENKTDSNSISGLNSFKPPAPPSPVSSEFSFGNPVPVSGIDEDIAGAEAVNLQKRFSGAPGTSVKDDGIKFVFSPPAKARQKKPAAKAAPVAKPAEAPASASASASASAAVKPASDSKPAAAAAAASIWNAVSDKVKCETCLVQNDKNATKCVSCETPLTKKSTASIWNMVSDKVKCNVCLVQNDKSAVKCVSCESPMASAPSTKSSGEGGGAAQPEPPKPSPFSFSAPAAPAPATEADPVKAPAAFSGFSFGSSSVAKTSDSPAVPGEVSKNIDASAFKFGSDTSKVGADAEKKTAFTLSTPSFGSAPVKADTEKSGAFSFSAPSFGAGPSKVGVADKEPSKDTDDSKEKSSAPPTFGSSSGFSFSGSSFGAVKSPPADAPVATDAKATESDEPTSTKRSRNSDEPAAAPASAPASTGFSFSTSSSAAPAPTFSGFSFSAAPSTEASKTAPAESAPSAISFGSFSSTPKPEATPAAPPATGMFQFSATGPEKKPTSAADPSAAAPFVFGGSTAAPAVAPAAPFVFGGSASSSSLTGGALSSAAGAAPFTFGAGSKPADSKAPESSEKSAAPAASPFVFGAASSTPAPVSAPFTFGAPAAAQASGGRSTPPPSFGVASGSPSGMDYSSGGENSNFAAPQTQAPPMFGAASAPIAGIGMLQNSAPSGGAPTFGAPSGGAMFSTSGSSMFGAPSGNNPAPSFGTPAGLTSSGGSSSNLAGVPAFGGSAAPFVFGAPPAAPAQTQPFGGGMGSNGGMGFNGGMGGEMNWGAGSTAAPLAPSGGGGGSMFSMGASGSTNSQTGGAAGPRRKLKAKRG